jgi:UDP-sugar transporter A1/2/3
VRKFTWSEIDFRAGLPYAVPAALYLVNNLLYFLALQLATPDLVHVAMMAKVCTLSIIENFRLMTSGNSSRLLQSSTTT